MLEFRDISSMSSNGYWQMTWVTLFDSTNMRAAASHGDPAVYTNSSVKSQIILAVSLQWLTCSLSRHALLLAWWPITPSIHLPPPAYPLSEFRIDSELFRCFILSVLFCFVFTNQVQVLRIGRNQVHGILRSQLRWSRSAGTCRCFQASNASMK